MQRDPRVGVRVLAHRGEPVVAGHETAAAEFDLQHQPVQCQPQRAPAARRRHRLDLPRPGGGAEHLPAVVAIDAARLARRAHVQPRMAVPAPQRFGGAQLRGRRQRVQ